MERKAICKNVGVCSLANKVQIITDDEAELICPECGEELELVKDEPLSTAAEDEKARKKKRIIAACVGVAVVAALGVGGYSMFSGGKKKAAPEPVKSETVKTYPIKDKTKKKDQGNTEQKPQEEVSVPDDKLGGTANGAAGELTGKEKELANPGGTKTGQQQATSTSGPDKKPAITPKPAPKPKPWASYATFDGTTMVFKKAHIIPGTNETAQPGDKVTGVWIDGEVNSVRWYHADGSPSEALTHK